MPAPHDTRPTIDPATVDFNVAVAGNRAAEAARQRPEDLATDLLVSAAARSGGRPAFQIPGLDFPEPTFGSLVAVKRMLREIPGLDQIDQAALTGYAYLNPDEAIRLLDDARGDELTRLALATFSRASMADMRRLDAWIASTFAAAETEGEATAATVGKPAPPSPTSSTT